MVHTTDHTRESKFTSIPPLLILFNNLACDLPWHLFKGMLKVSPSDISFLTSLLFLIQCCISSCLADTDDLSSRITLSFGCQIQQIHFRMDC